MFIINKVDFISWSIREFLTSSANYNEFVPTQFFEQLNVLFAELECGHDLFRVRDLVDEFFVEVWVGEARFFAEFLGCRGCFFVEVCSFHLELFNVLFFLLFLH